MLCIGFDKACFLRGLIFLLLLLPLWGLGQEISLELKNATLEETFQAIQNKTDYRFVYTREETAGLPPINMSIKQKPLKQVLDQVFANLPLDYAFEDRFIVIRRKEKPIPPPLTVRGVVQDEEGRAIAGATVLVKGGGKATASDSDGRFELREIDEKAVLVVSSIGYASKEVAVAGKSFLEIRLGMVVSPLDETVVVAYGTTTQRLNTGNVSRISASEIERQPVMNALAAMEGRIPGVVITQSSGVPGAAFKIEIRGQTTLDPNLSRNDPLFIIDGVPFAPGNTVTSQISSAANYNDPFRGLQGGLSPLNNINPADIESIEVLKDADATAIYGSRGANGVVLITTKRGKAGDTKVNVNIYSGASRVSRTMDMLNTQQYVAMRKEAFANDNIVPTATNAPDLMVWDTTRYTDLKKLLIGGTAHVQDAQASVSGGTAYLQYLLGGGYHKETTVFPGDMNNTRLSAHVSLNHSSANKKLSTRFSAYYGDENNNLTGTDFTNYINLPPNIQLHDATGALNWREGGVAFSSLNNFTNPLAELHKRYEAHTENLLSNLQLGYTVIKGLSLRASMGYNTVHTDESSIRPKAAIDPQSSALPSSSFATAMTRSWIAEPQAEYQLTLGKSKVNLLAGGTWQEIKSEGTTIAATNYSNDLLLRSVAAAGNINASNSYTTYRYTAAFGRLNYNYGDKYIVNLSGRRDGSSRFGPEKRFAYFGAAGAAWIFSNEPAIKKALGFLSYGKLRGSYGSSGNDQIGNYQFYDRWTSTSSPYQGSPGLQAAGLFNADYNWELTRKLEVALEAGFFKDRILLTASGYRNRSGNQLVSYILPIQTGFSTINKNLPALVENKGLEITLGTRNIATEKWQWSSSAFVTIPRNKLISFPGINTTGYAQLYREGYSLNSMRGYRFTGVDPVSGLYTFEDADGDGKISIPADYHIYPQTTSPQLFGGVNNSLHYKEWGLEFFVEYKKQKGLNYLATQIGRLPGMAYNQPTIVLNRWRPGHTQAEVQKFTTTLSSAAFLASLPLRNADAMYSDASYVRLRSLSISYTLPEKWIRQKIVESGRIYVQGQNLVTITGYKGAHPENQNLYALPPLQTITAGVQLSF